MKTVVMIIACVVVAISQTFILLGFLKKLKKIEIAFWGESAAKATADITKAKDKKRKNVEDEDAVTKKS